MPGVLPVISLQLFSFVKQANEDRSRVFRLGLAYAAGVFAWFLGFAGLVVSLRAAGHRVEEAPGTTNIYRVDGGDAVTGPVVLAMAIRLGLMDPPNSRTRRA